MKILKNIFKYCLTLSAFAALVSCDDYLDINENPNNPTEAPLAGLMTNSTYETAQNVFRLGSVTSSYVQYLASPNPSGSSDTMEATSFDNTWASLYSVMTDLNDMINAAKESGANHYEGAGQILLALNLAMTVDSFGDVPFSESFNFATLTPSYDDDAELYNKVLSLLNEGVSNMSQETTLPLGDDDFIYSGDPAKWVKFGNMLRARYLNHLSGTNAYDATAVLAALDSGFESSADDAQVEYFEQALNPWANVAIRNANLFLGGWISEQFIAAFDGTIHGVEDPRMPLLIGATSQGEYIGVKSGAGRGDAPESGARSTLIEGQFYTEREGPVLIATYFEQKFIEAEAAFTIDKSRSYQAYLDGIEAHMRKVGVPEAEIQAYLNNPEVSMGEAAFTIDDIFEEKWKAMFLHPEAWVDARRFNYQYEGFELPDNLNPDLNGQLIRRLAYPDSERSRNGSNVPDVTLLDRIFWNE
ncbi:SusD/RagB family nutrient-binding outer membrane lipoprotein [Antarcticibacterium arcticum]|uniref:SusD/RagB family nutrient-binding outer membrane lipoprotein n=1 Tax=Antarcticibacterium arcticum TaxID=2585771 RepID=A0A5B8YLX0_9FLAO|nr:SusD/RagB family nutrient-binding outer membrane lipoprotein [Antarcticibacterium arcticum]QED38912.1 SusD/RagB family nutrient-binding outer membrane lipoprotein [Antarcticibacterium arcticum]